MKERDQIVSSQKKVSFFAERGGILSKTAAVLIISSVGLCPYRMDVGAGGTGFIAWVYFGG